MTTIKVLDLKKINGMLSDFAAVLKRGWERTWRILTFSPADGLIAPGGSLCVSLEKGKLTVAYGVRSFSRIRLKGIREYAFEPDKYPKPENLAASLAHASAQFRAGRAEITLCIPKEWTILTTAELPAAVKENLSGVIAYELDRLTPLKPEEAYYDFRLLREEGEKIFILIEAAKMDLINAYLDVLRERDIPVVRITSQPSALGTYFTYIQGQGPLIFVEIGPDGYKGGFVDGGVTIKAFADRFRQKDNLSRMQEVAEEIVALADPFTRGDAAPCVFLKAGDKEAAILADEIPDRFKLRNACGAERSSFRDQEGGESGEAAGGLLESLWPKAVALNLLDKGIHRKEKIPLAPTVVLFLILLAVGILYLAASLQIEERKIREIDRQISLRLDDVRKVEALKKEIETLEGEIEAIETFKSKKPATLSILREMTLILPKNTWLSRLRIADPVADIEGYASSATELLPKLESSRYIRKVEFASPTFRDARMNADRFVIKMEIADVQAAEGNRDAEKE